VSEGVGEAQATKAFLSVKSVYKKTVTINMFLKKQVLINMKNKNLLSSPSYFKISIKMSKSKCFLIKIVSINMFFN
jgi:hypothetical protein